MTDLPPIIEPIQPKMKGSRGVIRNVDLTGDYETTIYDAARRLLAEGADPLDEVHTYRKGMISMKANIGWAAKWTVEFRAKGPCLARYKGPGLAPLAGEAADPGPKVPADFTRGRRTA